MTTKLWAVRSALTDLFAEATSVPVFDGPVARKTPPKEFVLVGTDGGETGTGEATGEGVDTRQSWATSDNRRRNEEAEVVCAVWAWSGQTKLPTLRETVAEILDQIEAALLADPTIGGVLTTAGLAKFDGFSLRERQLTAGPDIRARFVVSYVDRLIP